MGQKLKNINPDAEFLYETLANSIDGYIYLWDIKTDQYRVSEKMVEDFGFECIYPENFSEFWLSLIHERDAGRIQKVASRFIPSGKKKFNLEYQIQTVSGSYLWVGSKIDIKYDDESQTPLWGIGVIKNKALDQTIPPEVEIKRETPIEETETQRFTRKLKAILDATPLCLNLWDINLNNVMCNKEAVRLFDLENEQEYTKRFFELSPEYQPDGSLSSERAAVYIHQAFNGGWAQFNWMHCNLKGDLIPAEITLVKIEGLDDDGEDMVAGFTRDLRPQLVAQSAEKKAAQRINAALNSMPLTCLIFSPELELIDCNEVALKLFGVSDKEELGEHFDDFMPEYQPTGSLSLVKKNEVFQQTLETGRSFIEWMYINKNGEEIPSEVTLVKLKEDDGEIVLAYSRDLRELHQTLEMNTRLTRIAYFDPLTGSASRAKFMEHLAESFNAYSCGHKIKNFSLFILDFDNFKGVNDTYGHDAGDVTLRTIIRKIDAMLPVEGIIGRYGGDEFVIQLTDLTPNQVSELMNRCVKEIAQLTIESEEHHFKTSISIGGTFCQPDDPNIDTLIKRADIALYKAKSLGRNCFVLD